MAPKQTFKSAVSLILFAVQLATPVTARTQFASHVSISTPARSFTHGVGDPLPLLGTRHYNGYNRQSSFRSLPISNQHRGYPRVKPAKPFRNEDIIIHRGNRLNVSPWQYNNYMDVSIPVLPVSPYKVDSPDPESLWPEGLLVPSLNPPQFTSNRRSQVLSEPDDPYLLEGSEARAAVKRADLHGYYFHDIPHINSLLANQELRCIEIALQSKTDFMNNNLKAIRCVERTPTAYARSRLRREQQRHAQRSRRPYR